MKKEVTCKTGLKKNVIKKSVFDREVILCQQLSKGKKGCGWGKCKDCGVVPLLYKLHSGLLVEKKKDVAKLKKAYLG
jgi:hypothetical protein